jgi:hypothetical protein
MRLQEALETTEQGGLWQRLTFDPGAWLRQVRFSPALAAVLVVIGFAGGIGTTYSILGNRTSTVADTGTPSAPVQANILGIRSIVQQPGSDKVTIKYDTTSTENLEGSLNDQRIQQLLLFAARNNYNSGVRMDSVDLLTQAPNDNHVREALMYALRYDSNPGVRLKALAGLSAYVKSDTRVRDALVEALINDSNSGVRTQALQLLSAVSADSSVRNVLQQLSQNDKSPYIRSRARSMLSQLPEID